MSKSAITTEFQAIVLAAGKGTRMGSAERGVPKVLVPLLGRPILTYVLDVLAKVGIEHPVIVVGTDGEQMIREALGNTYAYAVQEEQLGSGHAVMSARDAASDHENLLVMCGDSPLFTEETVRSMMEAHLREDAAITLASATIEDPHGYGRIVRSSSGDIVGIVEEKSAKDEQKRIKEVNGGCYAFNGRWLWSNIDSMRVNEAGEYCLTEMVHIAIRQGLGVTSISVSPDEIVGVNTPSQLHDAEEILRNRTSS